MIVRRVRGASMEPALSSGDIVIGWRLPLRVGRVVIARYGGRDVIKRVERRDHNRVYLVGDNRQESTDSRHYGFLNESDILGTIMIVLPKAVQPPKPVRPYGIWLGRLLALILIALVLVHLFRIDRFLPILDEFLPGGSGVASLVGLLLILSEIFAIPFALRMKLSPLAHIVSGALLVLAPLWWLLIDIWTFGLVGNTGQLGSFADVPSAALPVVVNAAWVALAYFTLYTLGYNSLKTRSLLKK